MAMINQESSFVSWILTPSELKTGSILTTLQKQVIQNMIWQAATERINLPFLDENKQRDAELLGRIAALTSLLDLSLEAETPSTLNPQES
jgi:hypothetical protein